jgi:hypothetical protein
MRPEVIPGDASLCSTLHQSSTPPTFPVPVVEPLQPAASPPTYADAVDMLSPTSNAPGLISQIGLLFRRKSPNPASKPALAKGEGREYSTAPTPISNPNAQVVERGASEDGTVVLTATTDAAPVPERTIRCVLVGDPTVGKAIRIFFDGVGNWADLAPPQTPAVSTYITGTFPTEWIPSVRR